MPAVAAPCRWCTEKKPIEEVKKCRRGRGNHYFNFRPGTVSRREREGGNENDERDRRGEDGRRERESERGFQRDRGHEGEGGRGIVTKEGRERDG